MFDIGQKINIDSPTDKNTSLKGLFRFRNRYKQKQFRNTLSTGASLALLNDTDIHSDDDDLLDKRIYLNVFNLIFHLKQL